MTILRFVFTVAMLTAALLIGTSLSVPSAHATVLGDFRVSRDKCPLKPGIQYRPNCTWYHR